MAYKPQASFAAGELDPALHERTNFEKYNSGLATLRNAYIGKTGRVISRAGNKFLIKPKFDNKKCILFAPPYSDKLLEWGDLYVREHDLNNPGSYNEQPHTLTEADLPYIQFLANGKYVYISRFGQQIGKFGPDPAGIIGVNIFLVTSQIFDLPTPPTYVSSSSSGTGIQVSYAVTYVVDGQESLVTTYTSAALKLPINVGETTLLDFNVNLLLTSGDILSGNGKPSEFRIYRRPNGGAAYGYIGSSTSLYSAAFGPDFGWGMTFVDEGQDADYTNSPPAIETPTRLSDILSSDGPHKANGRTACVYQQRLLITEDFNEEAIYASRPGFQGNFTRDFPLSDDSALTFKAGTSGNAKVLRMVESGSLIVFTTAGIYASQSGALTPSNIGLDLKANYVIDEKIPPLQIPGAILFVDKLTNTVRTLIYSNDNNDFPGEETSIFSNHLFAGKTVISWTFQDGDVPLVWVTMDDGSLLSFTYQREHEMKAWARHDGSYAAFFESCATAKSLDKKAVTYFLVKRGTERFIEYTSNRFNEDIKELCLMDSSVTYDGDLTSLSGGALFTFVPVVSGVWDGLLTLTSSFGAFTNTAGNGAVGTIFRFFDSEGTSYDLTVTTYTNGSTVTVQPNIEFPSAEATAVTIYKTVQIVTGLSHLNGKQVSILSDGYVLSSPNNDIENYPTVTVSGGQITLPDSARGSIIHVGLPYTTDVETLDVDTVEQKPALLESKVVNRVYVKLHKSSTPYVASRFPKNDKVEGMTDLGVFQEDEEEVLGNTAPKLETKRYDISIHNDWKSKGRVCLRQVDPIPFEALSIIPDMMVVY